jgi:hypothetical protein
VNDNEKAQRLRNLVLSAMGDDLARASMAFDGLSDAALDEQYGQSGRTRREIWAYYKQRRAEDEELRAFVDTLLARAGL